MKVGMLPRNYEDGSVACEMSNTTLAWILDSGSGSIRPFYSDQFAFLDFTVAADC